MKCLLMIYNQRIELAGRFQMWMWINWCRDLIEQLLNQLSKTVVHQQLFWLKTQDIERHKYTISEIVWIVLRWTIVKWPTSWSQPIFEPFVRWSICKGSVERKHVLHGNHIFWPNSGEGRPARSSNQRDLATRKGLRIRWNKEEHTSV